MSDAQSGDGQPLLDPEVIPVRSADAASEPEEVIDPPAEETAPETEAPETEPVMQDCATIPPVPSKTLPHGRVVTYVPRQPCAHCQAKAAAARAALVSESRERGYRPGDLTRAAMRRLQARFSPREVAPSAMPAPAVAAQPAPESRPQLAAGPQPPRDEGLSRTGYRPGDISRAVLGRLRGSKREEVPPPQMATARAGAPR